MRRLREAKVASIISQGKSEQSFNAKANLTKRQGYAKQNDTVRNTHKNLLCCFVAG
jgi:hypothetical protein